MTDVPVSDKAGTLRPLSGAGKLMARAMTAARAAPVSSFSLTSDHRATDGAQAARFLAAPAFSA